MDAALCGELNELRLKSGDRRRRLRPWTSAAARCSRGRRWRSGARLAPERAFLGGGGRPPRPRPPPAPARPIYHGVAPPIFRVFVSWSSGNLLQVACLRPPGPKEAGARGAEEFSGSVVEVNLDVANGSAEVEEEIDEVEMRRIEYGSVPSFALLQIMKNALADAAAVQHMHSVSEHAEWWQYVLRYSKTIGKLLGNPDSLPAPMIEDPRAILKTYSSLSSCSSSTELASSDTHISAARPRWRLMGDGAGTGHRSGLRRSHGGVRWEADLSRGRAAAAVGGNY